MLLEHKKAVIYGAGGAIGGAVARTFAHEGADLFLASRTRARVESVAEEISAAGGVAEAAAVDALDEDAIEKHMDDVVARAQRIDVLFNAVGMDDVQGTVPVDMPAVTGDACRSADRHRALAWDHVTGISRPPVNASAHRTDLRGARLPAHHPHCSGLGDG